MKLRDLSSVAERRKDKQRFAAEIGKYLRTVREKKGISQEELSESAGYYRTYVGKIEQGKYSPSLHTVWRLAHTLGLNLKDFFKTFES